MKSLFYIHSRVAAWFAPSTDTILAPVIKGVERLYAHAEKQADKADELHGRITDLSIEAAALEDDSVRAHKQAEKLADLFDLHD